MSTHSPITKGLQLSKSKATPLTDDQGTSIWAVLEVRCSRLISQPLAEQPVKSDQAVVADQAVQADKTGVNGQAVAADLPVVVLEPRLAISTLAVVGAGCDPACPGRLEGRLQGHMHGALVPGPVAQACAATLFQHVALSEQLQPCATSPLFSVATPAMPPSCMTSPA